MAVLKYRDPADGRWVSVDQVQTGATGPAGPRGETIIDGEGPPPGTVGEDGSYYLDTAGHVLYGPKAGADWPVALVGSMSRLLELLEARIRELEGG